MPMWVCVNEPTGSQMIKPIDEQTIEHFAKLVRQDERKSCANILDAFAEDMEKKEWTMGAAAMRGAADTIRFKQTNDETEGQK